MSPQWVTMREAARAINRSPATLVRLAKENIIETKSSPVDKRVKLVDVEHLKQLYNIVKEQEKVQEHEG